jgi:hypothetical protein
MTDDIVTTLRRESFYRPTSRLNSFGMPQMGFELTSFNLIAADEIERLRRERDEARRRLCVELFEVEGHPFGWNGARGAAGIAERLGWDCFKEER